MSENKTNWIGKISHMQWVMNSQKHVPILWKQPVPMMSH